MKIPVTASFLKRLFGRSLEPSARYVWVMMMIIQTGCGTYYHYPTYQNIPVNRKAGEIRGDYFLSEASEGFSLSYSITKNLGAFVNVNTFKQYDFQEGAHMSDLGLYFFKAKNLTESPAITMTPSLSAAYGFGQYNRNRDYYRLDIHRAYLQPSVAITSNIIDIGLSGRLSRVDYQLDRFYNDESSEHHYANLYDVGKKPFYFFEPGFFIGVGYKWVKLQFHTFRSVQLDDSEILYYEDTGYLSLSIQLDLEKWF